MDISLKQPEITIWPGEQEFVVRIYNGMGRLISERYLEPNQKEIITPVSGQQIRIEQAAPLRAA